MALTLGGFCIGMVEHDRAAAREAFEVAAALSPSSALTYSMGSIVRVGRARQSVQSNEASKRCVLARSIPSLSGRGTVLPSDVSARAATRMRRMRRAWPSSAIQASAIPMRYSRRRL